MQWLFHNINMYKILHCTPKTSIMLYTDNISIKKKIADSSELLSNNLNKYLCCVVSLSCVWLFATPMDCSPPGSSVHGDSPGKNAGVDCHAPLQGFPAWGLNLGLPHCRWIQLYHLNHQGTNLLNASYVPGTILSIRDLY